LRRKPGGWGREGVLHDGGGSGFSSVANWYPGAKLAVVVLTNSEPDTIAVVREDLAAAVLPASRPAGPGRGADMVIDVTRTPQGIVFSFDGAAAGPLPWIESWTFRRNSSLLTFRRSANSSPATKLRFDTGGDHFILKRQ